MSTNKDRREEAQELLIQSIEKQNKKEKLQKNILISLSVVFAIIVTVSSSLVYLKKRNDRIEKAKWENCSYIVSEPNPKSKIKLPNEIASKQFQRKIQITIEVKGKKYNINGYLDEKKAPCAVNSIINLAKQNYYNNNLCNRLLIAEYGENFNKEQDPKKEAQKSPAHIMQCGDYIDNGQKNPGYTYAEEYPVINSEVADLKNNFQKLTEDQQAGEIDENDFKEKSEKMNDQYIGLLKEYYLNGVIAIANTGQPNSSAAQMFFVYDETVLEPNYTIAGKIDDKSVQILKSITKNGVIEPTKKPTDENSPAVSDGKPKDKIKIISFKILN